MLQHPMKLLALSALTAALGVGPVAAGSICCACSNTCAPVVVEVAPVTTPFYIVNQGPDYTGPGIVVGPYVGVDTAPATYPYVGRDYYYPPYPYARHHIPRAHVRWHGQHRVHVSQRYVSHGHISHKTMRPFDPRDK